MMGHLMDNDTEISTMLISESAIIEMEVMEASCHLRRSGRGYENLQAHGVWKRLALGGGGCACDFHYFVLSPEMKAIHVRKAKADQREWNVQSTIKTLNLSRHKEESHEKSHERRELWRWMIIDLVDLNRNLVIFYYLLNWSFNNNIILHSFSECSPLNIS